MLGKNLLDQPLQQRRTLRTLAVHPVVALDQQVINIFHAPDLSLGRGQARRRGESHAEGFIEDDSGESLHCRLQNVCTWRTTQGERDCIALQANGDLVLHASKREANASLAGQKWTARQFLENPREFVGRKRPVMVVGGRQVFSSRNERNGARAFSANPFEHDVIVAFADAQVEGDSFALTFLGQNASKVAPALIALETFPP